jgi:DNA helicase-2/ATP-dependent DNA helicase PcrA
LLGGHSLIGQPSRFIGEIGAINLSLRASGRVTDKPRLRQVAVGDRVVHTRWREGTVLRVEGSGRDTLVTIAFDRAGRQRLQLCHAPLQRIS